MEFEEELATLSISLDDNRENPLYRQLADQIRRLILGRRLTPGVRLPSSRKLARMLGLSRTTTLNAYGQLVAEGLLLTKAASGVFVTDLSDISQVVTEQRESRPQARVAIPSAEHNRGIFDAGPDIALFPAADWSRSLSRVWRHPDPSLMRDRHPGGYWPLRRTIARYVKALRGIECRPEQIIITAGNRDALSLIIHALLQSGDTVGVENPCYPPVRRGLISQGVQLVNCEVDSEGMGIPATPIRLAWMTPARQYPLGMPQSIERRVAWLDYSRRHRCWLVEDDYDSEFSYRKMPMVPLFSMAAKLPSSEQRTILVGSLSKVMFRTLRIGYLVVPEVLAEPLIDAQESLGTMASVPVQPALADFLGHRRFVAHLRSMRSLYLRRRDFLFELIRQRLGKQLDPELPSGGMHLLACMRPGYTVEDTWIERQLRREAIQAPALSSFYDGPATRQGLLLGFSGAAEEVLRAGVTKLSALLTRDPRGADRGPLS